MTSLKDFLLMLSYLQTIHPYFPLYMTARLLQDLEMMHDWAFQWKMNFNPGPIKQSHKVIFSRKTKKLPSS